MNRRNICALAMAGLFAMAPMGLPPAEAAEATRTKQVFFAADQSAPELARNYLQSHPGDAIQITSFNTAAAAVEIYHAFGPVTRSPQGVCRFVATQVFPHRSADGAISWNRTPPNPREHAEPRYTLGAAAGTPCPARSEDGYAAIENGISDSDFVAISDFWTAISKSEEKFDSATGLLSLIISSQTAKRFSAFRSAVFRPGGPQPLLQAVFRGGVDAYDLAFGDSPTASSSVFLSISKSADGFQVLNFQTQF